MANTLPAKVPTPTTTPSSTSLVYIVDSPYGTPADNATTVGNLVVKGHGLSDTTVLGIASGSIAAASTTGTGAVVRATSPALTTPTGIVKGDVGLGNVDNTSDFTKNSASATLTNKDLTSGTNTFPTSLVTLTGTQTLTNKTLTSPKIGTSILDTNGNNLLLLTATSSAVNGLTLANAATGFAPTLSATGTDTNVTFWLRGKGSGSVVMADGSSQKGLEVATNGTAVNNLLITGRATGVAPTLDAAGSDTDIDILVRPKGAGAIKTTGPIAIGLGGTTPVTVANPTLNASNTANGAVQLNVQNQSSGTSASSDLVATADTGSDTTNYVDLGINSSTYSDSSFTITGALDSYLYANGGNLAIGTQSAKDIVFHSNGTLAANERLRIASAGGVTVQAPGNASKSVLNTDATQTLTNKRVTNRVLPLSANSATPAINTDNYDVVHITAQSAAITSFTTNLTGTPVDGDTLRISVTGTGAIALTFGSSFEASGGVPLSTTTSGTARLDMGFLWNTETSKWRQVAQA